MKTRSVASVVSEKKCCSCGICAGVCPTACISMQLDGKKRLLPIIREDACRNCGICLEVCPGRESFEMSVEGRADKPVLHAYNGHTENEARLEHSVSGGICLQLVESLLASGSYQKVFSVTTWDLSDVVTTVPSECVTESMGGSRYVPVSHEQAVRYMVSHRDEKIILIGVGCAIRGFRNVIRTMKLDPDNYLLLGLFCDKALTYRVWDHFSGKTAGHGQLRELHFRSKKYGKWPGDMLLVCEHGEVSLPKQERQRVADFYTNERCLYCIDKLCLEADVSLGDNYTNMFVNPRGTSTVLIRTEAGQKAFEEVAAALALEETAMEPVMKSQQIGKNRQRISFARLRSGVKMVGGEKVRISYKTKLKYRYKRWKIFVSGNRLLVRVWSKLENVMKHGQNRNPSNNYHRGGGPL